MADGDAYRRVCAPVEKLGGHSGTLSPEEAGPGPALQKCPNTKVNFLSNRTPSFFPLCMQLFAALSQELNQKRQDLGVQPTA